MVTWPKYYTILVVDIERFGRRRNPVQALLRERSYRIFDEAIAALGIVAEEPEHADRGDGAFWLLPGSIPKVTLTGPFITALSAGLEAHNRVSAPEAQMRWRVALHAGEVSRDEHGWVGEDLNTACRLVDLQSLRDSLAQANAPVAVAVSEIWYRSTVRHDHAGINSAHYHPVPFRVKEVDQTAWITVPGRTESHAPTNDADQPTDSQEDHGVSGGVSAASAGPAADCGTTDDVSGTGKATRSLAEAINVGPFAGASIQARQVYGGDHYEVGGPK